MPTAVGHVAQARRNEDVSRIVQESHPEWAVTALFYAAMHYVEALFYVQQTARGLPKHYASHEERRQAIQQRANRIFVPYQTLLDESLEARYMCSHVSLEDVDALRDNQFAAVKAYITARLPPESHAASSEHG